MWCGIYVRCQDVYDLGKTLDIGSVRVVLFRDDYCGCVLNGFEKVYKRRYN
jgi:hypothetical protein